MNCIEPHCISTIENKFVAFSISLRGSESFHLISAYICLIFPSNWCLRQSVSFSFFPEFLNIHCFSHHQYWQWYKSYGHSIHIYILLLILYQHSNLQRRKPKWFSQTRSSVCSQMSPHLPWLRLGWVC